MDTLLVGLRKSEVIWKRFFRRYKMYTVVERKSRVQMAGRIKRTVSSDTGLRGTPKHVGGGQKNECRGPQQVRLALMVFGD